MEYKHRLIEGTFLRRYKRFFADVRVGSETVIAHVPNTGTLKGICDFGETLCRLSPADNPDRKLRWTLEQVQTPASWIGVNTHHANTLVWEQFRKRQVAKWQQFVDGRREVKVSASTRFDFGLSAAGRMHFVEVKSVTLGADGLARFPDAVTERGQKHLRELIARVNQVDEDGRRISCEIVFVVQREDCSRFCSADDIDENYGRLLREAFEAGVGVSVYPCRMSTETLDLDTSVQLPIADLIKS